MRPDARPHHGRLRDLRHAERAGDNAILVCHALSGDAHVAGVAPPRATSGRAGGTCSSDPARRSTPTSTSSSAPTCSAAATARPGRRASTRRPASATAPRSRSSPSPTWSRSRCCCSTTSASSRLLAVIGGSMGGMQVLQLATALTRSACTAPSPWPRAAHQPTQAIAFNEVGRQAIMADPDWRGGDYYGHTPPRQRPGGGAHDRSHHLPVRRGHAARSSGAACRTCATTRSPSRPTSRSRATCTTRAWRSPTASTPTATSTSRGRSTTSTSPAARPSLADALRHAQARFLVMSFSSDWLHPPYQLKEIVSALRATHKHVTYYEVQSALRSRRVPARAREDGGRDRGLPGQRREDLPRTHVRRRRAGGQARGGGDVAMDRFDYQLIEDMVPEGATVLDLGCGDGELLAELVARQARARQRRRHRPGRGRGLRRPRPVGLPRRPRRGPGRLRRRLDRRRHPQLQPAAAAPAAAGGARDGRGSASWPSSASPTSPTGRCAGSSSSGPHAGLEGAALPVVRHAQHPPLHRAATSATCAAREGLRIERETYLRPLRPAGPGACACRTSRRASRSSPSRGCPPAAG